MAEKMLGVDNGLQWLSGLCSARLFWGSTLVFLATASALAGNKPSQPTASGPTGVTAVMNGECATAAAKDQFGAASQTVRTSDSAAALTTTITDAGDDPQASKSEILQDKLWSTNLSRSSNDVPKAPQCGITTATRPPAN